MAVGLDENDKIELTFTDPSSTSKVSGTSFVPTAYTLSGTLTAQKVYAASADPADEKTFVDGKITVNYSGEVTGLTFTVDGATGKASAVSQTSGKFGTEAGNTVVADVLMGPALGEAEKDTDNVWSVALAPVEVTYTVPTTTTVIVD